MDFDPWPCAKKCSRRIPPASGGSPAAALSPRSAGHWGTAGERRWTRGGGGAVGRWGSLPLSPPFCLLFFFFRGGVPCKPAAAHFLFFSKKKWRFFPWSTTRQWASFFPPAVLCWVSINYQTKGALTGGLSSGCEIASMFLICPFSTFQGMDVVFFWTPYLAPKYLVEPKGKCVFAPSCSCLRGNHKTGWFASTLLAESCQKRPRWAFLTRGKEQRAPAPSGVSCRANRGFARAATPRKLIVTDWSQLAGFLSDGAGLGGEMGMYHLDRFLQQPRQETFRPHPRGFLS